MNKEAKVPAAAAARLDELGMILARGLLRREREIAGFSRGNPLEVGAEKRLTTTVVDETRDCE